MTAPAPYHIFIIYPSESPTGELELHIQTETTETTERTENPQ